MKTRKAKKPSEAKKAAAQLPQEDENEEIDVGGGEVDVELNATGRGKLLFFICYCIRTFHNLSKSNCK